MRELLRDADVLIENLRPGTLERLGLAPDDLLAVNPGLVILRVTGFGQTGPYAQRPGFATMAEAMSGFASINGEPDGAPLPPPIALTDEVTALVGAFAILAALRHRDRTGEGQVVDINLLDTMLSLMGPLHSASAHLGYEQPRLGSGIPYSVPRGTYQCADGKWVAVSASAESVAARLMTLLGVGDDDRFATFDSRVAHREELDAIVGAWIGARAAPEVIVAFESAEAAIAPVYSVAEVARDPHVMERESLIEVDGITMPGLIARFSRTPGDVRFAGRALGADTESVLAELAELAGKDEGPFRGRPGPQGQERKRRAPPRSVGVENRTWTGPNNSSGRLRARSVKDHRHQSNDRLWTTLGIDRLRLGMTLWILSPPSMTVTLRHLPDSGLSVTSWSLLSLSTASAPLSPGQADLSPHPWGLSWLLGRSSTTNWAVHQGEWGIE